MRRAAAWLLVVLTAFGCASDYSWRAKVPAKMRSVSVPVFRNESDIVELGSVAARQLLREFQREGTFKVASPGAAAVEIQGVVKSAGTSGFTYNRAPGMRFSDNTITAEIEISVVDKINGRVLVDNRIYRARATFTDNENYATSRRDSSGRLAEDLARQVLDDVLGLDWQRSCGDE
jgi:hypothetical protein